MDRSWLGKRKHFCFDCIDLQLIACLWQDSNSVLLHEGQHSLTFHLYCTTSTPLPATGAGSRPAETSDMISSLDTGLEFQHKLEQICVGGDCWMWSICSQGGRWLLKNSLIERPHWSVCHLSFHFFACSPSLIIFITVLSLPPLSLFCVFCLVVSRSAFHGILSCSSRGTLFAILSLLSAPFALSLLSFLPTRSFH